MVGVRKRRRTRGKKEEAVEEDVKEYVGGDGILAPWWLGCVLFFWVRR